MGFLLGLFYFQDLSADYLLIIFKYNSVFADIDAYHFASKRF